MKLEARQILHRGKPVWAVNLPASRIGKRRKVYRQTKADALEAARAVLDEHENHRGEMASLTISERSFILRWRGKLDLEGMEEACAAAFARVSFTAEEAVKDYLAAPRESPLSKEYLGSLRPRLKRFRQKFEGRALSSLTAGELQAFIRSQGASSTSYFSNLRSLFRHARLNEWVTKNPMEHVPRPEPAQADKELFTPAAMAAMLRACALGGEREEKGVAVKFAPSPALLRYLVLGGFCGLRHTESIRLLSEAVRDGDLEIHVRRMKTSKRGIRERFVQPDGPGIAWLQWAEAKWPKKAGKFVGLNDANLRRHRNELLAFLDAEWVDNGLRRSFGSYDLAARQDAAKTAEIMGHTDAETTKAKYRVPRRMEVGMEWFALTPEKVLQPTQ